MDQAMDDYRLLFPTLAGNAIFYVFMFPSFNKSYTVDRIYEYP